MKWKTRTRTLQRLIENWTLTTVVAYQLMKAKIKACIQIESTREKWLCKCIIILGTFLCRRSQNNRELKKPRRRRRGQRRLKNEFIFYLRISRYPKVIYFVYHCQSYHETESRTHRYLRNKKFKKLAVGIHVLQTTQNLAISRSCFPEDGKEMYKDL